MFKNLRSFMFWCVASLCVDVYVQAISPEQLAIIFEHIHQASFFSKYIKNASNLQDAEVFLMECRATACSNQELFKEIFGFEDNEWGRIILRYMFGELQGTILYPRENRGRVYADPVDNPFILALKIAMQMLIERSPELLVNKPQRITRLDLIGTQFNPTKTDRSEEEMAADLVNRFCERLKIAVETVNQGQRCKLNPFEENIAV